MNEDIHSNHVTVNQMLIAGTCAPNYLPRQAGSPWKPNILQKDIVRPNEWIGWGWRCAWPGYMFFSCLFCIQCLDCGDLKSIVCFTFWYVHGRVCEFPSHIELTSSILDQIWSVYVQTASPDRSGFVFKKSHDLSWPSCFIKSAWLTWGDHLVVCSAGNSSCWETQSRLSRVQHDGRPCKM